MCACFARKESATFSAGAIWRWRISLRNFSKPSSSALSWRHVAFSARPSALGLRVPPQSFSCAPLRIPIPSAPLLFLVADLVTSRMPLQNRQNRLVPKFVLHRLSCEFVSLRHQYEFRHQPVLPAFPRGGLGNFTHALAESAKQAGAEIRTDAEVKQIHMKDGAVIGIVLTGGEEIPVDAVVSGVDPKRTFFQLIDPSHLDPTFSNRIKNFRSNGTVAKVNLALGGLPTFSALDATEGFLEALSGRIHIGPEIDYLERAFDASKYGEFSKAPYLDVTIPTILDPALAPEGKHVLSACVQYAPYRLREGNWDLCRRELGATVIRTLASYAPDLPSLVEGIQVITPKDLETSYGFTGGHIFHGELALDQLFTMRPVLDWARYKTPIRGLFLCGSGTHPGNGLTGTSGANAAREIIRDLR